MTNTCVVNDINYNHISSIKSEVIICDCCGEERTYYKNEYVYKFKTKTFCSYGCRAKWQRLTGYKKEEDYTVY